MLCILAVLGTARPGLTGPTDTFLDLLQPGSRNDLGLGGDPFLSPVAGQSGWWWQESLDGGRDLRLETRHHLPVTRRLSGDDGEIVRHEVVLGAGRTLTWADRTIAMGLAAASRRTTAGWRDESSELLLDADGGRVTGVLRIEELVPCITAQGSAPLHRGADGEQSDPLRAGLRVDLAERLVLTASWFNRDNRRVVRANLDGEDVTVPFNLFSRGFDHGARAHLPFGLALEATIREADQLLIEPRRGRGDEALPDGWSLARQQGIEWSPGPWNLLWRHSDLRLRLDGQGYWNGQRYAILHHTRVALVSRLYAVQFRPRPDHRLFIEYERVRADAYGRLGVDSWRFASWQEAWSGAKKIIRLTGAARWERYHAAAEGRWGRWRLGGGLTYYDLHPDIVTENWIHIPFARPQQYERSGVETKRFSLGAVSVRARRDFGPLSTEVSLLQFVHADDHRDEAPAETGTPGPAGDAAPKPGGWYGGTYIEFTFGYTF